MAMNKQPETKPLEPDAAGVYVLDKEAKVMLLQMLKDGFCTEDMSQQLARKLGTQPIAITFACDVPESAICHNAFETIEARCKLCPLIDGCSYWKSYGLHYTNDMALYHRLKNNGTTMGQQCASTEIERAHK